MKRFVEGVDRGQATLFPEYLEEWICDDALALGLPDLKDPTLLVFACAHVFVSHRERVRATNTSNKTEAFDDRRITVRRNR